MNGVLRSLDAQWGWAGPELLRGQLVQGSGPYTSQVKQIPQMLSKHLQGLATMFLIKHGQDQVLVLRLLQLLQGGGYMPC